MWSRRKFIEASVLSHLALSSGALELLYSCSPGGTSAQVLDPLLQKVLIAAMDEIIPADEEMPSASEAGGLNYLLNLLQQFPEELKKISSGLVDLNNRSLEQFQNEFTRIGSGERIHLLEHMEKEEGIFFVKLRDYTYESYYLSPKVWKLIGYEPHPTLSSGPVMEAFDEKLLERVRAMPKLFKDI